MKRTMMKLSLATGLAGVLMLGACGTEEVDHASETVQSMEPVEAELNVPATADKEETVILSVRVTQDGEAVDDADEIKFEVWKNGAKEDSEMMKASLTEDGVYEVETTFADEAVDAHDADDERDGRSSGNGG